MFKNLKTQLMIAIMTFACMPVQAVRAAGLDDDMSGTLSTFAPVLDKIKKPLSMVLQIVCIGLAVFSVVKGVMAFAASNQEENPNEKKQKKDVAIRNFIAAAIYISAIIIINIFLNIMGITF